MGDGVLWRLTSHLVKGLGPPFLSPSTPLAPLGGPGGGPRFSLSSPLPLASPKGLLLTTAALMSSTSLTAFFCSTLLLFPFSWRNLCLASLSPARSPRTSAAASSPSSSPLRSSSQPCCSLAACSASPGTAATSLTTLTLLLAASTPSPPTGRTALTAIRPSATWRAATSSAGGMQVQTPGARPPRLSTDD